MSVSMWILMLHVRALVYHTLFNSSESVALFENSYDLQIGRASNVPDLVLLCLDTKELAQAKESSEILDPSMQKARISQTPSEYRNESLLYNLGLQFKNFESITPPPPLPKEPARILLTIKQCVVVVLVTTAKTFTRGNLQKNDK